MKRTALLTSVLAPSLAAVLPVAALSALAQQELKGPEQPIPYSHKQHLALKLACSDCHLNPEPGDAMTLPAAANCMNCHSTIRKDSPAIQKLTAYKPEIPWVRVYKVPEFVFFSHKTHLGKGAKCEDCHGQVAQQDRLFREGDLSMAGCMSCHREHDAPMGCESCHDARGGVH